MSAAWRRASARSDARPWIRSGWATASPTVMAGLRAAWGSWNTGCIRRRRGRSSGLRQVGDVAALELHRPRRRLHQPQHRAARASSCRSRSRPTRPKISPGVDLEVDAVDRPHPRRRPPDQRPEEPAAHRELGADAPQAEQRLGPARGSASPRGSPSSDGVVERGPAGPTGTHRWSGMAGVGAGIQVARDLGAVVRRAPAPAPTSRQTAMANGHRSANRQPGGGSSRSGGEPGIDDSRSVSRLITLASRPWV